LQLQSGDTSWQQLFESAQQADCVSEPQFSIEHYQQQLDAYTNRQRRNNPQRTGEYLRNQDANDNDDRSLHYSDNEDDYNSDEDLFPETNANYPLHVDSEARQQLHDWIRLIRIPVEQENLIFELGNREMDINHDWLISIEHLSFAEHLMTAIDREKNAQQIEGTNIKNICRY
jgi:hypothetical protein